MYLVRPYAHLAVWWLVSLLAASAQAQLRVVTYNTATGNPGGVQTARAGAAAVLEAIGVESKLGIAKPIDVLLLQEQYTVQISTQSFADEMNDIYDTDAYQRGTLNALTNSLNRSGGGPGIVFNSATVELLEEIRLGLVSDDHQPRSAMRYKLRPVGYGDDTIFYVYNDHYKSDTGLENEARRLEEAQAVRANADALGDGAHVLYVGDFNIQSASDDMYQWLTSDGPGKAYDPIDQTASWHNSNTLRWTHTQSPLVDNAGGLTGGGIDDRFDFQLVTAPFDDGLGLSIIDGTYRAFGNNGTHVCCGSSIDTGTGASPATLGALMTASDHLPVVADYQLPAIMQAVAGNVPASLELGQTFNLDVVVTNAANVVAAIGADLLRYSLTTSGDLSGSFLNRTDAALGDGNLHLVGFDTSTFGPKSGTIQIASTSQQVANGLINIPVNYTVIAAGIPGDYNGNGIVDAADYTPWRDSLNASVATGTGADGSPDGIVNSGDFDMWRANFGAMTGGAARTAVPEPSNALLVILAVTAGGLPGLLYKTHGRLP